jgi:hypothetical protein
VIVGPRVLPPEYLDPNFAGMAAYSPAPTDPTSLRAACAAISGSAQCATTYIELAPTFAGGTGTIALGYKGYVKNPGKASQLIYPLVVCSPRAAIGDRTKLAQLGHFRHLDLNGAQWLWVHGLATEYPLTAGTPPVQPDITPAIDLDGSTDCFVTRCWLDAPCCIHTQNAVRPRVGGNDLYGTPDVVGNTNWITTFYSELNGGPHTAVKRTLTAHIYQNFFGMLRPPALEPGSGGGGPVDTSGSFYAGNGVAPDQGYEGTYPAQPYDLNWRESWFFNNLIMTTKDYLIYNKNICNLYRNRVVSLKNWTDITGTGNAFHLIAARGGNVIGDNAGTTCAFKYNVIEADRTPAAHCDIQGWKTTWKFNDFGGNQVNIYMHCGRTGRTPSGKVYKTLLAGSYSRFVGNIGGVYVVGNSRADAGYSYYAPVLDCRWEGESGGAWVWEGTDAGVVASPNGTTIVWGIDGKNTETFRLTFPGDTAKVGCAPGQLTRAAGTVETAEMTLAYAGNGFTKAEKGIASQEGLVWDYVGDGGGGGDGPDGTYGLTQNNMTVHLPSDDMPTDYPHVALTWLAGGGFDLKANNAQSDPPYGHACIYLWHKLAPPLGDVEFNFYATMVDNNPSLTTDGVFSLFSPRARGIAAYGADPNGWAPDSWRTMTAYPTPGSDNIYRSRMLGYRHSFMNSANTVPNSMQFRIRTYNGVDDGGTQLTPTVPNPIPNSGDSFLFAQGTRYLINVVRAGTVETGTKTDPAGGTQVWTFDDPALGDTGKGVGGWCGFQVALGRHAKIEPVPGVPFCRPYSAPPPPPPPGGGDPVDPWWRIPGGNRSGKLWNRGPGLTFAASAWTPKMGAYDVTTGASHRSESTMNEVIGGPVSGNLADYDSVSKIMSGSQLDWGNTSMDSAALSAVKGKTWLIWVPDTNPTGGPYDTGGHNPNTTVWSTWAKPGVHDDWWYAMGRRARAVMLSYGLQPWQLMLRMNHEMNQSNNYQTYYGTGPDYAGAMGRFITGFRAGYAAHSADDYPRMIFSPSRHLDCGPLERFFTCDPVALTTPYDLVDVSAHPATTMNKYAAGYTLAQQVDQVKIWMAGGNDGNPRPTDDFPGGVGVGHYAQNSSVNNYSMIKLAKKYSIGMCNSEWSARYDMGGCTVSAAVNQAMHDWFTANAPWYAFECVFHSNTLNKTVAVANWAAGVDVFVNLWTGDPAEAHPAATSFNPGSVHTGKLTLA